MNSEPENIEALAALADGTLAPELRERLLAQVADSPVLAAELESQRRAVAIVRSLEHVEAPSLLRRSIETLTVEDGPASAHPASARRVRRPARLRLQAAAAVGLAVAAAVALILALGSGGSSPSPTVLQASSFALHPSTQAAPVESPHNRHLLAASAAGISYPYWGASLGWRAAGARTDSVGGHTVTTVFYTDSRARRIGYSIVSGAALPVPASAPVAERHGLSFHVLSAASPTVVTWREAGHTCILTARGVSAATLVRLAAWERT